MSRPLLTFGDGQGSCHATRAVSHADVTAPSADKLVRAAALTPTDVKATLTAWRILDFRRRVPADSRQCAARSALRTKTQSPNSSPGQACTSATSEMLASLTRIQAAVSQADAAVHDHVAVLRDRGISWTRIGEALGVSKQAAWERFSGED